MASMTSGASGSTIGRNRWRMVPSGRHQELLEVPLDVTGLAVGVGEGGQLLVDRVPVVAVDVDLLEHREGDPVGGRAERGDLLGAPGLLCAELVAGEAEDGETLVAVGLLESLEPFVLRGEPALGGNVDHQQRLAPVVAEGGRLALRACGGRCRGWSWTPV